MERQNPAWEMEQLIDVYGLSKVVEALAQVCDLKEEHIRTNWQDYGLANEYGGISGKLFELTGYIESKRL